MDIRRIFKTRYQKSVRRVAFIGNGPINGRMGFDIGRHDLVIRFNACLNFGKKTGRRTDILVLVNTGHSGQLLAYKSDAIDIEALASAKKIWLTSSPDVIAFEKENGEINDEIPVHEDRAGDWDDFAEAIKAQRCGNKPFEIIEGKHYFACQDLLRGYGAKPGTRPSSGFLALYRIRDLIKPDRISLYGFSHEGWPGHPWSAERAAIDAMPEVTRINKPSLLGKFVRHFTNSAA